MRLDSTTIQRTLSLLIFSAYMIYEFRYVGESSPYYVSPEIAMALATGMIWWPEQFIKGPGLLPVIRGIGWFLLLIIPFAILQARY